MSGHFRHSGSILRSCSPEVTSLPCKTDFKRVTAHRAFSLKLGGPLKYFFQTWRTPIPKINFIWNTWDISGTKHKHIIRWLGFAPYKASGRGHINSINLVNARNFRNFEIPVLENFLEGSKRTNDRVKM